MIKWFKKLFRIVEKYDSDRAYDQSQILASAKLIRDRTRVHADIHFKDHPDQVIVVGRYRDHDYFEVFSIHNRDMKHLIDMLKDMQKAGIVTTIDAPLGYASIIRDEL